MFDCHASLAATTRQDACGCCKITEDLARYRIVIAGYQPDVIVECGTFTGRSAVWFADTAGCPVVTVDVYPRVDAETRVMADGRVTWIEGSSIDPSTVATVRAVVAGCERPMVVLDSDHSADHVAAEMAAYGPLVPPGGWMVVEDGIVRWMTGQPYRGSPLDAIEDWLDARSDWRVDRGVCDMFPVTMHPEGWLRRYETAGTASSAE